MASQPTFAPYTPAQVPIPLPAREFYKGFAPKPNIRIAYIAGDAATAIHRGMASFTETKRESTLEELAIAGLTDELIAAGRELLSPAMYAAFLRWGETASHACAFYETDEEGFARCAAVVDAVAAVTDLAAGNIHDVVFKAHLINIEAGDCADFGPVNGDAADGAKLPGLIDSVSNDFRTLSPVIALLVDLTTLAWASSGMKALSLTVPVGAIITGAFSFARGELDLAIPAPAPLPAVLEGYNPYMRGPLIAWRKAYAVYEAAAGELSTYERTVYKPTARQYTELRGDITQPLTPELEARLDTIPMDEVQDRFDELVMAEHEACERLWAVPAPSTAELATKLKIFHKAEGWDLSCARSVIDRITTDARRFAKHGAFLQSDCSILAAFAGCRHETIGAHGPDAMTRDEEDAYFRRLDAYETTLFDTPAATLEGVIAKLRVAFSRINPNAWSDHAIMDPTSSDFITGLRMDGMFERMAWGAIEDLARIGGIHLAEQGA